MARSKCPSCNNHIFEVVEHTPRKSNFKFLFVQCSSCGSVVGTMDYYNIGALIKVLEKKIDELPQVSGLNQSLNIINNNVTKLVKLIGGLKK